MRTVTYKYMSSLSGLTVTILIFQALDFFVSVTTMKLVVSAEHLLLVYFALLQCQPEQPNPQ